MATATKEVKTQIPSSLLAVTSNRSATTGFLIVGESNLPSIPSGACVRIQAISFSKLQTGDYIVISSDKGAVARRFVKLSTTNGVTRLVVTDGEEKEQSIPFPRLIGLVSGVKLDGDAYNPNPQGFLQRAAFRLRHARLAVTRRV